VEFKTILEERASEAPSLEAFSQLSLYGIRVAATKLLELIGRDGIFREYTRHDISHIDRLLQSLEWIIPPDTLSRMTVADCLMTTLAIYFHDLGMLVTRDEFERRNETSFPEFRKSAFDEDKGKDYREKIDKMPGDQRERFLYEEFVREHHAERIRDWVTGKIRKGLGAAEGVVEELNKLLGGLDKKFRKDLGLVCESHHRNDLDKLDRYNPCQSYGSGKQETVNLQYCSILLRSADLLHVTGDRAPSISFRMINPSDPKSIEEWHKQMPVISVRPKASVDADGNVNPSLQMNTVTISGLFDEPQGFFALTAYLDYAKKELKKSNDWAELAKKKGGSTYDFPWRDIDESKLEAEGFVDKQFEFTLDQAKILDLLTGRTLYNDTTVVLRELVQNSLDAIRLQAEEETERIGAGEIGVIWNSDERLLTVWDNGTGMTQSTIDRHFLKVGSSLYQDEEFRKTHPDFSAISRFGIGVLSTFMISDEIEVTTCHPDEPQARTLSLRSLHGKYLVRLTDKDSQDLPKNIHPHGTRITLKVRNRAELKDPESILRHWILFPRCKVTVTIDGGAPVSIGFSDPKEALEKELKRLRMSPEPENSEQPKDRAVKVVQASKNGVTLAYAVQWSSNFREWTFLQGNYGPRERTQVLVTGSCIEGVRVDFPSPGYQDFNFLSLANAVGPNAPKTNVARSTLELTPERKSLLKTEYELYCEHVTAEVNELHQTRGVSLTWALGEATWFLDALMRNTASDYQELQRACAEVPSIALEKHGSREGVSPQRLSEYEVFWTADSVFFSAAETLLREISEPVAISRLATSMGTESLNLPPEPYISLPRPRSVAQRLAFQNREVNRIVIHREQRRVDLRWANISTVPLWRNGLPENHETQAALNQLGAQISGNFGQRLPDIWIAQQDIEIQGLDEETTISSLGRLFILPSNHSKFLSELLGDLDESLDKIKLAMYVIVMIVATNEIGLANPGEYAKQLLATATRFLGVSLNSLEESKLMATLGTTATKSFNPLASTRA